MSENAPKFTLNLSITYVRCYASPYFQLTSDPSKLHHGIPSRLVGTTLCTPWHSCSPKFSLQGQCTSECNIRYSQDFLKLNMRKLKLSQFSVNCHMRLYKPMQCWCGAGGLSSIGGEIFFCQM